NGPLPAARALRLCTDILRSLRDAHEQGLVHGRLRPDHVLLEGHDSPAGEQAKVLGYWPTNASVRREQDEVFCAPEQRDEKAPTARGDIFSVGAILAYCLVGEAPGAGLLPSSGRSDIDDVCRAALAREPELRFANA